MNTGYGIALSGQLPIKRLAYLASSAEQLGYQSVWSTVLAGKTDPAESLRVLGHAAPTLPIGLGLVPVDAFDVDKIARAADEVGPSRVIVAIGAGTVRDRAPERVASAILELSTRSPTVTVAVGAYGARVLAEAGRWADGILLNWSTARHADWAATVASSLRPREIASERIRRFVYVPTAVGTDARQRLDAELKVMSSKPYHREHQAKEGSRSLGTAASEFAIARRELSRLRAQESVVLPYVNDPADLDQFLRGLAPSNALSS